MKEHVFAALDRCDAQEQMLSIDPWQLAIEVQHTVAEAMELNIWQLNDICKEWQDKKRTKQ